MASRLQTARALAQVFLSGPWHQSALRRRAILALGREWPWIEPLVVGVVTWFGTARRPSPRDLAKYIHGFENFRAAWHGGAEAPAILRYPLEPADPEPTLPCFAETLLPRIHTPGALACWLGLTPTELDWFADPPGRESGLQEGPLRHYVYRVSPKASGGIRIIEAPKPRLKVIQRRILREVLDRIPPHEASHGFRPGRSCLTYSAPHCGQRVVMRMDLQDFFPSITAGRVHALFRKLGYPWAVARLLTGLCTNSVPFSVLRDPPLERGCSPPPLDWASKKRLQAPHLPQGSPTSPALSNLCAFRLDRRLAGLARCLGGRYTRYADDLALSGGPALRRNGHRIQVFAAAIALEEGFAVNTRKTRIMGQAGRQRLTGLVVNRHPNLPREDYDRLKATLHNCLRHGPQSQNRAGGPDFRARLAGRVAHAESVNPARGRRLRDLFDKIDWNPMNN